MAQLASILPSAWGARFLNTVCDWTGAMCGVTEENVQSLDVTRDGKRIALSFETNFVGDPEVVTYAIYEVGQDEFLRDLNVRDVNNDGKPDVQVSICRQSKSGPATCQTFWLNNPDVVQRVRNAIQSFNTVSIEDLAQPFSPQPL